MLSYQTFITFPNLSILTLCSLYQFLSLYQSFVVLSNSCHLLAPCYLFTFYVIISPYKYTYCTHHKHNTLLCFIVRTLSALIYPSNSPAAFGHRAILLWGGSRHGWGFSLRKSVTLQFLITKLSYYFLKERTPANINLRKIRMTSRTVNCANISVVSFMHAKPN